MELLYIWVDKFRKFENQGFTFSSKYRFTENFYKDDQDIEHIDITVDRKPDYINLFPSSYLNITALIGENSAGKSTMLDLLKLLAGESSRLAGRIIFCYRLPSEPEIIYTVYYLQGRATKGLKVTIQRSETFIDHIILKHPIPYSVKKDPGSKIPLNFKGVEQSLSMVTGIFFTNTFEKSIENLYYGITNLSTNALLLKKMQEFLSNYDKIKNTEIELQPKNPVSDFFEKELKHQIDFISFAKNKQLDLPDLPSNLRISFNKNDFDRIVGLETTLKWDKTALQLLDKKAFAEFQREKDPKKRIRYIVCVLALYYMLRWDVFKKGNISNIDLVNEKLKEIAHQSLVIDGVIELIADTCKGRLEAQFVAIYKLVDGSLEKQLQKSGVAEDPNNLFNFTFSVYESNLWEILRLILDIKFLEDSPFLEYTWYGISSGQQALLSQFARFYSIKQTIDSPVIWILIDEGELYFHPQWQKEYFNKILEFFPIIYPDKDIQLFISSHSPFVLSDLPKNHIVLLTKQKYDIEVSEMKETFGSNIHTLFTNSFFLNGLMGNFAKKKIDSAINFLNGNLGKTDFTSIDEVQKLVRIIGEPIIRNQLQKMIDSKRLEFVQEKYTSLEKRVKKLETKTNPK